MPLLQQFCQLLYDSSFGTMVRESNNAFPIIESIHVLSITLLVGSIAILDLRMLGLVLRSIPVTRIARGVLPLTWSGFTVSFVILKVIDMTMGLRVTEEQEREGLDISLHGEKVE